MVLEYALLGLMTAVAAAVIGTTASWAFIDGFLQSEFRFDGWLVFDNIQGICHSRFRLVGALKTLGRKPAPLLRELS